MVDYLKKGHVCAVVVVAFVIFRVVDEGTVLLRDAITCRNTAQQTQHRLNMVARKTNALRTYCQSYLPQNIHFTCIFVYIQNFSHVVKITPGPRVFWGPIPILILGNLKIPITDISAG